MYYVLCGYVTYINTSTLVMKTVLWLLFDKNKFAIANNNNQTMIKSTNQFLQWYALNLS